MKTEGIICSAAERARYTEVLDSMLKKESGIDKILSINYESDYSGYVDIDVLLKDGRVFSYKYYYGSCSGCDEWEHQGYTDEAIELIMKNEGTWFKDMPDWDKFNAMKNRENDKIDRV